MVCSSTHPVFAVLGIHCARGVRHSLNPLNTYDDLTRTWWEATGYVTQQYVTHEERTVSRYLMDSMSLLKPRVHAWIFVLKRRVKAFRIMKGILWIWSMLRATHDVPCIDANSKLKVLGDKWDTFTVMQPYVLDEMNDNSAFWVGVQLAPDMLHRHHLLL